MPNVRRSTFSSLLIAGLAIGVPKAVHADMDQHLESNGWMELTFDGKAANSFDMRDDQILSVKSNDSVSVLQKPMTVDIGSTPILTWRWCVSKSAPATDLTAKGEDDRSLALFVAFPFVEEDATFFEKIERRIVEREAGPDAPGRVLMYVWGGEGTRGDVQKSPFLGDGGRMIILRPADTKDGTWFEEQVDVAEDYRRIFGNEAPPAMSIAVSADTDDTDSQAHGQIANLDFIKRPASF